MAPDALAWALPPVRAWFAERFGTPTPAQRGGWPSIASGRHTLICAPTGTGKTLAAFLACLDSAWRGEARPGVTRVLYISPLKALNRDVAVNLEAPLAGIARTADRLGAPLRPLTVGVRTGDTTASERRSQSNRPPDLLITTPESLHLLLLSRQRESLRGVSHVIVDEIHDLCSNKRGVSLALLLERLELLCPSPFVRIGLSATLDPLDAVARFLGGWGPSGTDRPGSRVGPRPVVIVDAGISKRIELKVAAAFPSDRDSGSGLESRLLDLIGSHRSTLIFANHRGEVERLTLRLNERRAGGGGVPGPDGAIRSHHGSLSLDRRKETEEALKRGEAAAVVATASLELGIDIGTVDLVCQVGSPGSVARGLQRVGRAGHSADAPSRAYLFGRTDSELLELAALAGAMREGAVEPVRIPRDCLDVLAQQVVACVAVESWDALTLLEVVRRADPYRDLPAERFESVLAMLSGRSEGVDVRDLRPRIRWDRVTNRLEPLPGTRRHALMGGNTIPDSGQVPVYLDGGPRLGEFDEDFLMERRAGDAVLLGTSAWVIRSIEPRRVTVSPAEGRPAVVPFWRGEGLGRSTGLGERVGALRRAVSERIGDPGLLPWLIDRHAVEPAAADALVERIAHQVREAGAVPDDRTVLVESFLDQAGVATIALLTPFGRRFHLGLKLVLQGVLRERFGISAGCLHTDDGLLIPFEGIDAPPLDVLDRLSPEDCDRYLLEELSGSALFGLRFRQNAARALLIGLPGSTSRTPLWFQRLRAEELLGTLRAIPDHPLIVETYRECLNDDLDLPKLRSVVRAIRDGSIAIRVLRGAASPSPFAMELARSFNGRFVDRSEGRARKRSRGPIGDRAKSGASVGDAIDPEHVLSWVDPIAVLRVDSRLRGLSNPPRTAEEMAELLRFCGDLSAADCSGPMRPLLDELEARGIAERRRIVGVDDPERWILTESIPLYDAAFVVERAGKPATASPRPARSTTELARSRDEAVERVVRAYLRSRALAGAEELAARYGIGPEQARRLLERWVASGEVVPVRSEAGSEPDRWGDRRNIEDVRRVSIALRRKEAIAVDPDVFADLLIRHQHLHPESPLLGRDGLEAVLRQLRGFAPIAELWESELLPRRVGDFSPSRIDEFLRTEGWIWRLVDDGSEPARLAIMPRGFPGNWGIPDDPPSRSGVEAAILEILDASEPIESDELGELLGIDPKALAAALAGLSARGRIGGDHLDPIRHARPSPDVTAAGVRSRRGPASTRSGRRRVRGAWWETSGIRWSGLMTAPGDRHGDVMAWAHALLDRYGVLCRETAALDPWAPPWSTLRQSLDAAELSGEVRRGYFVAGLSGVQFALESFADRLARHRLDEERPFAILLSTLDPANLYGAGGPFDLPRGSRLTRSASNHVVLARGRPVLLSEGFARKVTTMPWANDRELEAALATLSGLARPARRVLKIQVIDGRPALESRFAVHLIENGFVRNPPGLAYYAGW